MPSYILHQGANVQCAHLGPAQPTRVDPRVQLSGQAAVVQPDPYFISGCQFPAWTLGGSPPCTTATWTTAAQRVRASGLPILLLESQSVCQPNGTPLIILQTQLRVTAT